MNVDERTENAVEYKKSMNCCQAVTAAFADDVGMDADKLKAISKGFGSGMGSMEATCGALCGAVMTAGLMAKGGPVPARKIITRFGELSGATVCKDLKGRDTGVVLCSCDDCVRNAVRALCEAMDAYTNG